MPKHIIIFYMGLASMAAATSQAFRTHDDCFSRSKDTWWPGFIVVQHDGHHKVMYVSKKWKDAWCPHIGDELIACDNIPISLYQKTCVYQSKKDNSSMFILGTDDFFYRPHSCIFLANGCQRMVPLLWKRRTKRYLDGDIGRIQDLS
jgi:hypothetical protein